MDELSNKPGLTLAGKSWDAQHLDKFLTSEWGGKLYKQQKPTEDPLPFYTSPFLKSSIRPSASFMSEPRERKVISTIDKPQPSTLVSWTGKSTSKSPLRKNLNELSSKMCEIESLQKTSETEYCKLIGPKKRRQIFEAEKLRTKVYSELKKEKLLEIKKNRIVQYEYPEGILGVDSPDRSDLSPFYNKVQKQNEKFNKNQAATRIARAKYIMNHTAANAKIQFFNEKNAEILEEKPEGIKRVDLTGIHYHDTQTSLFTPLPVQNSPGRSVRLKHIWRGGRTFNIISGTEYEH